jgi:hypothetical protein
MAISGSSVRGVIVGLATLLAVRFFLVPNIVRLNSQDEQPPS